jgi:hypothetical protein
MIPRLEKHCAIIPAGSLAVTCNIAKMPSARAPTGGRLNGSRHRHHSIGSLSWQNIAGAKKKSPAFTNGGATKKCGRKAR